MASRNNHFNVQTNISQMDKVLFCLWLFVVFWQKTVSVHVSDVNDQNQRPKKPPKKTKNASLDTRDERMIMTPACAFSINQSVGTGNTQRGEESHISVSRMLSLLSQLTIAEV